jgi:hypothetical protein
VLDDPNYHGADDLDDPNCRDAADDRGQNFLLDEPDDPNYRGVLDDRVDLVDHDDRQHLLDAVVYYPLQMV